MRMMVSVAARVAVIMALDGWAAVLVVAVLSTSIPFLASLLIPLSVLTSIIIRLTIIAVVIRA